MFVLKNNRVENFVLQLSHLTKSLHRSCEENFFFFLSRKSGRNERKMAKVSISVLEQCFRNTDKKEKERRKKEFIMCDAHDLFHHVKS